MEILYWIGAILIPIILPLLIYIIYPDFYNYTMFSSKRKEYRADKKLN